MELLLLLLAIGIVLTIFVFFKQKSNISFTPQINETASGEDASATEFDRYIDEAIEESQWSELEGVAKVEYFSRKEELKSLEESLGVREQMCPSCQAILPKMPKRKSKCKSCGEPVFPRTLPNDNEPRLYSEATLPLFDETCAYQAEEWIQWRTYQMHDELTHKKHEAIRLTLADEWKVSPDTIGEGDITWREHQYALDKAIKKNDDFGAYIANEQLLRQLDSEAKYDKVFPVISQCLFFHNRAWNGGANLSPILCQMIATAMKALCLSEAELVKKIDAPLSMSLGNGNTRAVILSQLRKDMNDFIG